MRKYWQRCGEQGETLVQSAARFGHWQILMTLITESAGLVTFSELCDAMSCTLSRDVARYLAQGKTYLADHSSYSARSIESIRASRNIWSLLKKFPFSPEECATDRKAVATEKLLLAESQCRSTNEKLRMLSIGDRPPFLFRARRLIAEMLGECRPHVMDILSRSRPGKGSTTANTGGRVTPYYKFADLPYTVTAKAAPYALAMISGDPHWWEYLENSGRREVVPLNVWPHGNMSRAQSQINLFWDCVTLSESDIIQFVPKDASTDRPMAVGASLNMMLQLGVNAFLAERLETVGVYIRDQARNQKFARLGSLASGQHPLLAGSQYSTIDLSSASDTISYELVRELLPSDWFAFLCDLRHETGTLADRTVTYEKFSAMGNGFTFPLESLIFWAVSKAASEVNGIPCAYDDIAVYGDDIIVRHRAASFVIEALEWCGFSVNTDKTFLSGCFKESCGADFWNGNNIRPIHLKRVLDENGLYYLANRISDTQCYGPGLPGLNAVYAECVRLLGPQRSYGPLRSLSRDELSVPEDYLSVPIQSLRHPGLRPFLSPREVEFLVRRRMFPADPHGPAGSYTPLLHDVVDGKSEATLRSPVAMYKTRVPHPYTGRGSVRYYIKLRQFNGVLVNKGPVFSVEDLLHIEAAGEGRVTQRGKLETVWRARPVLDWNGLHAHDAQLRHPAMWVDLAA